MASISQLDGTCSANCCNADGASDEPCATYDEPAVKPSFESSIERIDYASTEAPAELRTREPSDEPVLIPTKSRGYSEEPASKKIKVTPKKDNAKQITPEKTNYFGTSEGPMTNSEEK
ncbi:hypothetical protein Sste5346_007005 [Sporothrix stenoceras]|uniref:Uncharacterized protein n=1 Tax=Sporothrix stenoceras TaxID=5173 RepID=A0ABR3YVS6_9PEZI